MTYQDYVEMALEENGQTKLILKGEVSIEQSEKIGVVSVVFITKNVQKAKLKLDELNSTKNEDDYYMLYSCPEDTDLAELSHYPSIQITKEDLE